MNLGNTIKHIRKNHFKGSQKDFAEAIGVSQTHICAVEIGKSMPSMDLIQKIAVKLEIPITAIIWMATEESDVTESKRKAFGMIKPHIDNLLEEIFNNDLQTKN